MSHVPTVLKSDRSVFDKMPPVGDNGVHNGNWLRPLVALFSAIKFDLTIFVECHPVITSTK